MAFREEREIDDWFEQEKEKLANAFMASLEKGADDTVARAAFDKAFKKLLAKYDESYTAMDKAQARRTKLRKPFKRIADWWDSHLLAVSLWSKQRKELRKKKKFEREYKKLFTKKKD